MRIEVIDTPELGDRSYLVHDGESGLVIDPQRDTGRITALARQLGVRIALVAETHIHNDYVTGGYQLAREYAAPYAVQADENVGFRRLGVRDGDELPVGTLRVGVIATPGHTPGHVAYAVSSTEVSSTEVSGIAGPAAVFTGGSLLYGSVGRTDLVDPALTRELALAQVRSVRRLAATLAGPTTVHPTHGFGSFCSAGGGAGATASTIAGERAGNEALTDPDERAFAERMVAGLAAYPAYYRQMAPLNRRGPGPLDLSSPAPVSPRALGRRIAAGEWVIDLRDRAAFAAGHLAGTVGAEPGAQFATYLGWTMPWGTPLTLIGPTAAHVTAAQRQLARIGIDRLRGAAVGPLEVIGTGLDRAAYPRAVFADVPVPAAGEVVLDVRSAQEFAGQHLPGARNVPLGDLPGRVTGLPPGLLWVHCAAGYRAGIAASLLQRAGRDVVLVDDDFAAFAAARVAV